MPARLRRDRLTLEQRNSTLSFAFANRNRYGLYFKDDKKLYYADDSSAGEAALSGVLDVHDVDDVVSITDAYPIVVPDGLLHDEGSDVVALSAAPGADVRKWFSLFSNSAAMSPINLGAPTEDGTPASSFDSDRHYRQYTSGAVAGNAGGIRNGTINTFRPSHNPYFVAHVKPVTVTNVRYWVGAFDAAPGNIATLGAIDAFGFSWFNTDTNWQLVTCNGTTTTFTNTGVALNANQGYVLKAWMYGTTVYGQVDDNPVVSTILTPPAAATELTYFVRVVTTTGSGAVIKIASLWVDFD